MKKSRQWQRILLGIIYLVGIVTLVYVVRKEYVLEKNSPLLDDIAEDVVFVVSTEIDKEQTVLSSLSVDGTDNNWFTGTLPNNLNSTSVFLDYISINGKSSVNPYCFSSFYLSNIAYWQAAEAKVNGAVGDIDEQGKFVFTYPICFFGGAIHEVPHIFLGHTTSEFYADLGVAKINGSRAFDFFPFDRQRINLSIMGEYIVDQESLTIAPNIVVTNLQEGWTGRLEKINNEIFLNLSRPILYQLGLVFTYLIFLILIVFLSDIVNAAGGFFEIMIGLLVGLSGLRAILLPNYINTSIPVDAFIYVCFMLILGEIVIVMLDENIGLGQKQKLKIEAAVNDKLNGEIVMIENRSLFPIDLTGWLLSDKNGILFRFPKFTLEGKSLLARKASTINIGSISDEQTVSKTIEGSYFYWGEREKVIRPNEKTHTFYLEDSEGELVQYHIYAIPKRHNRRRKNS